MPDDQPPARKGTRKRHKSNIQLPEWKPPIWDPEHVVASLDALRAYAEATASGAIAWYYQRKTLKAISSRFLRLFTILATSAGGLIPVLVSTGMFGGGTAAEMQLRNAQVNQIGYFCLGLAALALALDRFFGNSTGWMRYITTAMSLETAREQFRLDWAKLTASLGGKPPEGAALEALIKRITEFGLTVRALVESETKEWASEFQSNLTELDKKTQAALESARMQADNAQKQADAQRDATRPGAIEVTVENGDETDAGYTVTLDDKPAKSGVIGKSCAIRNVPPGLHEVEVVATIGGGKAAAAQMVNVQANSIAKATLTLAKAKAAGKS